MKEIYPAARHSEIIVQELNDELLIYDLLIHKAYCLNQTSATVYRLCDGKSSVSELRRQLAVKLKQSIPEDFLWLALDQLKEDNLLQNSQQIEIEFNGLSRREMIRKVGLTSMAALPIIAGLIAPPAASAASCIASGGRCSLNNPGACCSLTCNNNGGSPICGGSCTPNGGSCSLNNPGACCSSVCSNNGGSPICGLTCTPSGGSCSLNNPGACCSSICNNNGGNPVCN